MHHLLKTKLRVFRSFPGRSKCCQFWQIRRNENTLFLRCSIFIQLSSHVATETVQTALTACLPLFSQLWPSFNFYIQIYRSYKCNACINQRAPSHNAMLPKVTHNSNGSFSFSCFSLPGQMTDQHPRIINPVLASCAPATHRPDILKYKNKLSELPKLERPSLPPVAIVGPASVVAVALLGLEHALSRARAEALHLAVALRSSRARPVTLLQMLLLVPCSRRAAVRATSARAERRTAPVFARTILLFGTDVIVFLVVFVSVLVFLRVRVFLPLPRGGISISVFPFLDRTSAATSTSARV